ncbi:MAG: 3-(3-hydroxyphenyl)propionate hydroxylase, partial [Alphaproteobacteria bacterium]|nr:3-(3-hydroxyphenyl)propionate hydroxylase [Alphaproteobacteria bacterium]
MTMQSMQCDVAIVGAGPTGLTIATLLGLAGLDVVLIERNPSTVQAPRAVSIDDESLRTMQACGLIENIIAQTALDYGAHYYSPSGKVFARIEPPGREYGYPRRSAFLQPEFEATLREGLSRFSNVRQLFSHNLETITDRSDGVDLQVTQHDGGSLQISAQWLAGCDGG